MNIAIKETDEFAPKRIKVGDLTLAFPTYNNGDHGVIGKIVAISTLEGLNVVEAQAITGCGKRSLYLTIDMLIILRGTWYDLFDYKLATADEIEKYCRCNKIYLGDIDNYIYAVRNKGNQLILGNNSIKLLGDSEKNWLISLIQRQVDSMNVLLSLTDNSNLQLIKNG